eukprot:gene31801-7001_t
MLSSKTLLNTRPLQKACTRIAAPRPVGPKPLLSPSKPDASIAVHASNGSMGGLEIAEGPIVVDRSKGLWTRCDKCGVILYIKHLKEHNHICFGCNHHMKMSSSERIDSLIDAGTFRSFDDTLSPVDPLEFKDQKLYTDRIKIAQQATGLQDGVVTGTGLLHGIPVALGVMDFSYMGGSMGSVVGEKLTRLIEYATQEGLALMIVCTSGGARMQEGILSLMQMAKISGALHVHQNAAKLLYIAILASPTTGGVTASFGMLGDIIIAEPQAIIGFAGRRVIEQTLQEQLPADFQTAEYLLDKGLLDLVVPRTFLKRAQGSIPFGVQHGIYMAGEEKVRRKWKQWAGGEAAAAALEAAESKPSYKELVSSLEAAVALQVAESKPRYKELVLSLEGLVGSGNEINLQDLMNDEQALASALSVAKDGKVSWIEQQSKRLQKDTKYTIMTSKQ